MTLEERYAAVENLLTTLILRTTSENKRLILPEVKAALLAVLDATRDSIAGSHYEETNPLRERIEKLGGEG